MKRLIFRIWAFPPVLILGLLLLLLLVSLVSGSTFRVGEIALALCGTLSVGILTLLLSIPCALSIAVILGQSAQDSLLRKWGERWLRFQCGIPSLAWALVGMIVLVPLVARWESTLGYSVDGLGLIVAIPILTACTIPRLGLSTLRILQEVPGSLLKTAFALGVSPRDSFIRVVLPYARGKILRVLSITLCKLTGEAVIVILLLGSSPWLPESWFDPMTTLSQTLLNAGMGHSVRSDSGGYALAAIVVVLLTAVFPALTGREDDRA